MSLVVTAVLLRLLTAGAFATPASDAVHFVKSALSGISTDFTAFRGKQIGDSSPDVGTTWQAVGPFGSSLSGCTVTYLAADGFGDPASYGLGCKGMRRHMSQDAQIAWAIKTLSPLLPGYTMKTYGHNPKESLAMGADRKSVHWKSGKIDVDVIVLGPSSYHDGIAGGLGYDIDVSESH